MAEYTSKDIEKLLKAFEAQNAEIAALKEQIAPKQNEKARSTPAEIAEANERGEEYVEIRLFKDGDRYKDDVTVIVNGEACRVKRGKTVRIKRKFAEVIAQSEKNAIRAAEAEDAAQERFRRDSEKYF